MTDNLFFFREDYDLREKEERIRAEEFTKDNPPVLRIIDKTRISPNEVRDMGREEFLNILREDLGESKYRDFINTMFEDYGHEGDRFNQQLFLLPPKTDLDDLYEQLSRFEDGPLKKPFGFILTQPLYLNEMKKEGSMIDLLFHTSYKNKEYESDDEIPIRVLDEDGNTVETLSENQRVKVPSRKRVEARIYPTRRLMAISNSEVPQGLQSDIFNVVLAIINDSPEIGGMEVKADD